MCVMRHACIWFLVDIFLGPIWSLNMSLEVKKLVSDALVLKISLFHLLILQIQSVLEFRHLKDFWSPFNLWKIVRACKTSVNSIGLFLRYNQFKSPQTRLTVPIFYHAQTKNLWSTFNFCEFVSTSKKWGCFIDLFWRSNWFNPPIWLAEQELCLKTKESLDFHYKTNSVIKSTSKFFFKFKKSFFGLFLAHFPNYWGKKSFSKKFGSFVYNSIRDFNAMPRFREN